MVGVNVLIIGDDVAVSAMLTRMDTALNPIAIGEFLGITVDPYIRKRAKSRFASEGDDVTGAWAPLADTTQDFRKNQGFGPDHPINIRTGELENYITGTPGGVVANASGALLTSPGNPPSVEMGLETKVKTAQGGKTYPSTPARPVMGVNEQDLSTVLTALTEFVIERVR